MTEALMFQMTQQEFAELIGVSQQRVSELLALGVLRRDDTALGWLHSYCERLREQAAVYQSDGGLDLVQERAALARAQREAWEMKNTAARAEFAPVEVLEGVLQDVSREIAGSMDTLASTLHETCPDLPEAARLVVLQVIGSARSEWVRSTSSLQSASAEPQDDELVDEMPDQEGQP